MAMDSAESLGANMGSAHNQPEAFHKTCSLLVCCQKTIQVDIILGPQEHGLFTQFYLCLTCIPTEV